MTKFNVGDKVQFIEDYMDYKKGDVVEVIGFWAEGINYVGKHGRGGAYYNRFELVESKPTKNQRITALENEVAELKLIVHEFLDKKVTTTATVFLDGVPVDINNAPEIQLKAAPTPNQQRAAIIEKAKKFVDENKSKYRSEWNIVGKTVQILIYDSNGMLMMFRQAKCNPNDVFNEHIGKAIALGRALGLDVSEFEQAVQPDKPVIGMMFVGCEGDVREIAPRGHYSELSMKSAIDSEYVEDCPIQIINDTNAKYEVSSNE